MRKLLWIMFGMLIATSCEMSKDRDADFVRRYAEPAQI